MLKRIGTVIALPWPGWQTTGGRGIFHDYRGPWKRTSPSQRKEMQGAISATGSLVIAPTKRSRTAVADASKTVVEPLSNPAAGCVRLLPHGECSKSKSFRGGRDAPDWGMTSTPVRRDSYPTPRGRKEELRNLLKRRFVLDRRRQALLDCCALSPVSREPSQLSAASYIHVTNTAARRRESANPSMTLSICDR